MQPQNMDFQKENNIQHVDQQVKQHQTNGKIIAENQNMDEDFKKASELNDMPNIQSIPSIVSMQDQNHQSLANNQEDDPLVQIQIKKQTSQIQADQILKIFNSLKSEPNKKPSKTSKPIQKKKSQTKPILPVRKIQFSHLSEKAKLAINKMFDRFKTMYTPSRQSTQFQKFRCDGKLKLYLYLWYGAQQLKLLDEGQLNQVQKKLIKRSTEQWSNHIRRIGMEIDKSLRALNKNNQLIVSRQLRNQWNILISNIKDQTNRQLRRKVLNGSFTPQAMVEAKELQFYTSQKKEQILKKQKLFLAEFQAEQKVNTPVVQSLQAIDHRSLVTDQNTIKYQDKQKQTSKVTNAQLRFFNETSIKKVHEMISSNHFQKMRKRLENDLKGELKNNLIKHLIKLA